MYWLKEKNTVATDQELTGRNFGASSFVRVIVNFMTKIPNL